MYVVMDIGLGEFSAGLSQPLRRIMKKMLFYGSSRRVQEDPGSGKFEVKVGLIPTNNSAASVCTVGSTVAGLMAVVFGAAGVAGAALML